METVLYTDDEKICFSHNKHTLYISTTGKPFTKRKTMSGFTYDKKTKKVKFWFGKPYTLNNKEFEALKKLLGIDVDWINDLKHHSIHVILSNATIVGKILSGKITNCRDMIKQYLKTSARGVKLSAEIVYQYLKKETYGSNLKLLLAHAKICVDPNDVFKPQYDLDGHNLRDMLNQARRLGKKVDLKWSEKRKAQVHAEWTREIMAVEIKYLEERTVGMIGELQLPEGFELVTNQKRCFEIGSIEKHCVYTNFWARLAKKELYIIYGEYQGKMYTCSIHKKETWVGLGVFTAPEPIELQGNDEVAPEPAWQIGQLQAIGNTGAPQELRDIISKWIDQPKNTKFFNVNYRNEPIDGHTTDHVDNIVENPRVQMLEDMEF